MRYSSKPLRVVPTHNERRRRPLNSWSNSLALASGRPRSRDPAQSLDVVGHDLHAVQLPQPLQTTLVPRKPSESDSSVLWGNVSKRPMSGAQDAPESTCEMDGLARWTVHRLICDCERRFPSYLLGRPRPPCSNSQERVHRIRIAESLSVRKEPGESVNNAGDTAPLPSASWSGGQARRQQVWSSEK